MNKLTLVVPLIAGLSASVFAADWYVSSDRSYGTDEGADETHRKDSIQEAVDAAANGGTDTIWVKDGFVCNSGSSNNARVYMAWNKVVTLRSESGDWRTGTTIIGEPDPTSGDKGAGAVRCIHAGANGIKIIGFVLKGAHIPSTGSNNLGAILANGGGVTVENCLICDNATSALYQQNVFTASRVYNSIISNNVGGLSKCIVTNSQIVGNTVASGCGGASTSVLIDCDIIGNVTTNSSGTSYCRGGGVTDSVLTNCFLCNNRAYNGKGGQQYGVGGAAYASTLVGCTLSNNYCQANGGACAGCSLYSCTNVYNRAGASGGGAYGGSNTVISNCLFAANVAGGSGGGLYQNIGHVKIFDTDFLSNQAGGSGGGMGAYKDVANTGSAEIHNCTFAGNLAKNGGGGGLYGDGVDYIQVYDSVFSNNVLQSATVYNGGGGASMAQLERCVVVSNAVLASQSNAFGGGGICKCTATDCVISNNASRGNGGVYGGTLTRCVIVDNLSYAPGLSDWGGNGGGVGAGATGDSGQTVLNNCSIIGNTGYWRGGAISGSAICYNCLIAGNQCIGTGNSGGAACWGGKFYNCTISGNMSVKGSGGVHDATVENSIIWGNTGPGNNGLTAAASSCIENPSTTFATVFSADPKFRATEGPLAYQLKPTSPCRDYADATTGTWMTDESDPRSKDLAGKARVNGSRPDLGCYECYPRIGLILLLR